MFFSFLLLQFYYFCQALNKIDTLYKLSVRTDTVFFELKRFGKEIACVVKHADKTRDFPLVMKGLTKAL